MDRRGFLGTGAAAAAAALAGSACAPGFRLTERGPVEMPTDMDGYIGRIDSGMERLSRYSTEPWTPEFKGDRATADAIGRTALQAMFFTGMVGDLPREGQMHPEIQARIQANMPLMDEATGRMTDFLHGSTSRDLLTVQRALRDHQAGPQVFSALDSAAGDLGVSAWRRAQTRALFTNAEWRLRNQPPALVVSEFLEKVDRLVASDVPHEARQQEFAAILAREAFWAQEQPETKRHRRISKGGRTMGYGALTFAASGLVIVLGSGTGVYFLAGVGLVGATVGVVMMLVGLVILLVGLATP